ncbi:DUF3592 domain-containing protein [Pedosphaera parvula]|uniref:DUF3592 domain-containing protein n=1 Tax=Pedosphaera parvula (strain Ellin514) TaxID=320771 RepID=B9XHX5_PEDPL|nr:DUF3592 domain-containing protein [Pedosphaera parvula]EEF60468.1 hypothetical protein Cflav_PD3438 [Pedosphaera parvula Ellin514]
MFMVGVVFSLIGLVCLFFSFCLFRGAFRKRNGWKSAPGIVVGYVESIRDGQRHYRSQVQFTAKGGNPVVITSNIGSNTHLNRIGDQVKVLYDLNNPAQGVIKSFSTLYMPGIVLAFIAVCFSGVGGHILYSLDSSKM